MRSSLVLLTLVIGTTLFASSGASLYNTSCKGCHGVKGETLAMGKSKAIKGMPIESIESAMKDYVSGERKASLLIKNIKKDFMRKHSKEELNSVAIYIHNL